MPWSTFKDKIMKDELTFWPKLSDDGYGGRTWGPAVLVRCRWNAQREALFTRISREENTLKLVQAAFATLGGKDWYTIERTGDDDWHGHGLPDLLEAWDFAYQLNVPLQDYKEV